MAKQNLVTPLRMVGAGLIVLGLIIIYPGGLVIFPGSVTAASQSISLTPAAATISAGSALTFKATVTPNPGSGTIVQLCEGSSCTNGGIGNGTTNSNGVATISPTFNHAGTHPVFATDSTGAKSPSSSITVTGSSGVDVLTITATTTTTITSGSQVSFTVTDTGPTGNLLQNENVTLCQTSACGGGGIANGLTNANGVVKFNPKFTSTGTHSITAQDITGAVSTAIVVTVTGGTTSTTKTVTSISTTITTVVSNYTTISNSTLIQNSTQTITTAITSTASFNPFNGLDTSNILFGLLVVIVGFFLAIYKF